jgi:hypothetical protein
MKKSEKNKDKAEGKIFRKRSHSCVEERFYLTTRYLFFAAICNRKRFLEVPLCHFVSAGFTGGYSDFALWDNKANLTNGFTIDTINKPQASCFCNH